jgi:hypothetical protein
MEYDADDYDKLEQLVQKTRWDQVTAARERVVERFEIIDEMQFGSKTRLTRDECALLTQRATQLFVREVETIINPTNSEPTAWWDNKTIGTFEIPTGEQVHIIGLSDYLDLDEQLTYVTHETHKPHGGALPQRRQVERAMTPPVGIHREAFSATDRALAEKGIRLEPDDPDVGAETVTNNPV